MDGESSCDGSRSIPLPILFLHGGKKRTGRGRSKRKNASAGRSAQAQTSCRRRGMGGTPSRQSGTETPGPWGILRPGEVQGYPSAPLSAAAGGSLRKQAEKRTSQRPVLFLFVPQKIIGCDTQYFCDHFQFNIGNCSFSSLHQLDCVFIQIKTFELQLFSKLTLRTLRRHCNPHLRKVPPT